MRVPTVAHRPAQPADGVIPGYLRGKKTFGIVLNPDKWDIMCSFPRDGQTDYRRCSGPLEQDDNCVDGCSPTFDATWNPSLSFWCTSGFPNRTCGFHRIRLSSKSISIISRLISLSLSPRFTRFDSPVSLCHVSGFPALGLLRRLRDHTPLGG